MVAAASTEGQNNEDAADDDDDDDDDEFYIPASAESEEDAIAPPPIAPQEKFATNKKDPPPPIPTSSQDPVEELLTKKIRNCRITKAPMFSSDSIIYEFSDEKNQSYAAVDIFVPALPPEYFVAKINQDDSSILEFSLITPTSFFTSKRLTAKGLPDSERLGKQHAKVKSLGSEGHKLLVEAQDSGRLKRNGVVGAPVRIQLPFRVEKELVSSKLCGHGHDDKEMQNLGQGLFIYSIVVENVEKPRKIKKRNTLMTLFTSPLKGDSDSDADEQAAEEIDAYHSQTRWKTKMRTDEDGDHRMSGTSETAASGVSSSGATNLAG